MFQISGESISLTPTTAKIGGTYSTQVATMPAMILAFRQQKAVMQKTRNFYLIPFYFVLLSGLLSCGNLSQAGLNRINLKPNADVTKIRDLKPAPDKESTVYLQGKVVKQVPLVEQRVYQLQDSTGKIWVLTNQKDLRLEDKVLIKGNVRYQSIPLGGKDFGEVYVEEQEQLEHVSAR